MKIFTEGVPYPIPNQLLSKLSRELEIFYNKVSLKKLWWQPTSPPVANHWNYGWETEDRRTWTNSVRLDADGQFYITYATDDEFVEGLAAAHVQVRVAIEGLARVGLTKLTCLFNE